MSGGPSIYQQITGIGDAFSKSYEGARKEKLASDLGAKIKAGDLTGAADVAFQGGDVQTGLALFKLGDSRAADKRFEQGLGNYLGGGSGDPPAAGTLGGMGSGYLGRGSAPAEPARVPSFAGGGARMALPGSGGETETKFVDTLKAGGLTNPYGLAAMAAYAQHESRYSPKNIMGSWSDPSESGQPGTSGGILSWRGDRLANMRRATAGAPDPVVAQAKFALTESPELTLALQRAGSAEEANSLMANAWKFAGYNRPGGENAARLASTQAYVGRLGGGALAPTRVAGLNPDAANRPDEGAQPAEFFVPPGPGGQGTASLGRPAPHNVAGPSTAAPPGAVQPATASGTVAAAGSGQGFGVGSMPVSVQLAGAGVPRQDAVAIGQQPPGSPGRINGLISLSLIPGLSEQRQGVVKTLLNHELDRSKEGGQIRAQIQAREAEVIRRGLDPLEPRNQRYIFTGSMPEEKTRTQIIKGEDGGQYVVDPENAATLANPTRVNLPPSGPRIWGQTGPDGQIVQPPPGIQAGTAGYYDAKGEPQLISGKGVNVTTNVGAGETEEAKEAGKLRGKRISDIETAATKAPDQIGKLNLLAGVLDRARTGTLGPAESKVVGLAQSLGIPNETLANLGLNPAQAVTSQVATKLTNELVTGMIGGGGFPSNNFSNSDREFLTDIFPKMSNRPEANRMAIEVLKRVQERNLEFGDAWQGYQQAQQEAGRPARVAEFEFNFRKGLRGKPDLFSDLRQQLDALPRGGAGGGSGDGNGTLPRFSPSSTKIAMPDAQALKAAEDTAENRQTFDARYGAGAARFVLGRDLPGGGQDRSAAEARPAGTGVPPVPGLTITPRDSSALRSQPDTAEARTAFDAKYGQGAAQGVLGRPPPKEKDRTPIPGGVSAAAAIAEAKRVAKERPDLKAEMQERLHSWGIDPKRIDQ